MINCPNPSCKDLNAEGNEVCQTCHSALPHRYLWGVGQILSTLRPGELYQNRYLLKRDRIFLDTQPGLVPESLTELPSFLLPYLHLSAYPVQTPKPYAVIRSSDDDYVLMLESSALSTPAPSQKDQPAQLPKLSTRWADAPPLRQLNWLWQISTIWAAFQAEQVASTLLNDDWVRVDGSIVRLLELSSLPIAPSNVRTQLQSKTQPTLMALGRHWQTLADQAHQSTRAFLNALCEKLERQQLNSEQLTEQLSRAIAECAIGQSVSYELAVYTDQGPTRKRNEDACYPSSGTHLPLTSEKTHQSPQLLIVCDGIGGHQGGDIASKLAIATIEARLKPLLREDSPELSATELCIAIEQAICAANDEISAQNDQAQRQARDRMGTTLVLALVKGAEIYIAHLGDSRAYRIGYRNAQQVTLDDDVASRQVRLGGSLYREVLVQPGSGSLIQALGMSSSQTLRPTVQRFVMDENCVFLLCSDGLSDSDRVEQFWQKVLWPLVTAEQPTQKAAQQLIALANKFNGHDNVTVGLLSAQVIRASARMLPKDLVAAPTTARVSAVGGESPGNRSQKRNARGANRGNTQITSVPNSSGLAAEDTERTRSPVATQQPRESITSVGADATKRTHQASGSGPQRIGLFVGLLAIAATTLYFLFPGLSWQFRSDSDRENSALPAGESSSKNISTPADAPPLADVRTGNYLRIRQTDIPITVTPTAEDADSTQLLLYPKPTVGPNALPGAIPTGSIVRVLEQQTSEQVDWAKVQLCSIPSGDSLSDVPTESDSESDRSLDSEPDNQPTVGEPLPQPLADGSSQPLMLSPEAEGWAVTPSLAAVADNIQDLNPTQQGKCER